MSVKVRQVSCLPTCWTWSNRILDEIEVVLSVGSRQVISKAVETVEVGCSLTGRWRRRGMALSGSRVAPRWC